MKANELRIGNLLSAHWKNEPFKVTGEIIYEVENYEHEYNPIPLTEEWLEKFGLEVYDVMGGNIFLAFRQIEPYDFNFMLCDGALKVSFYRLNWDRSFEIKHVHQFQNLYFALTGEELELKSDKL
jgi:hypothetical protein